MPVINENLHEASPFHFSLFVVDKFGSLLVENGEPLVSVTCRIIQHSKSWGGGAPAWSRRVIRWYERDVTPSVYKDESILWDHWDGVLTNDVLLCQFTLHVCLWPQGDTQKQASSELKPTNDRDWISSSDWRQTSTIIVSVGIIYSMRDLICATSYRV